MRYRADIRAGAWVVLEANYSFKDPFQYAREVTRACTEAEANIIAFALNAVAEDRLLTAFVRGDADFRYYDGPTEGVRP